MTAFSADGTDVCLIPVPLTAAAFAPFGGVIEMPAQGGHSINDGMAVIHADPVILDLNRTGGRASLQLVRARPLPLPARLQRLERHMLSSQTFLPVGNRRFLVVVASGQGTGADDLRAFVTDGRQGVHYAASTWHHPLIAWAEEADFVVIGRSAAAVDCEYVDLTRTVVLTDPEGEHP